MQNDPESRNTKLLSPVGVKAKFCFMHSLSNEFHHYISGGFLGVFVCLFKKYINPTPTLVKHFSKKFLSCIFFCSYFWQLLSLLVSEAVVRRDNCANPKAVVRQDDCANQAACYYQKGQVWSPPPPAFSQRTLAPHFHRRSTQCSSDLFMNLCSSLN